MHCFSFDIETVPDVEFGRRMWDLDGLSDKDVGTAMFFKSCKGDGEPYQYWDFAPGDDDEDFVVGIERWGTEYEASIGEWVEFITSY